MRVWLAACLTASGVLLIGTPRELSAAPPVDLPPSRPAPVELPTGQMQGSDDFSLPPAEIRELIRSLVSDRFDVRESATRRLEQAGAGAIPFLAQAAQEDNLEITCRSIRALSAIAQQGDRATFETAQSELEKLADSRSRAAARRAQATLGSLSQTRRRHALDRVIEMGARVMQPQPVAGLGLIDDDGGISQMLLDRNWKGGDDGLIHFRRLEQVRLLYITVSAPISKKALDELQRAMPELRVQTRGDAMLGASCSSNGAHPVVDRVSRGTAADKCGLEVGDEIVQYDGKELVTFEELIEITKGHAVGDKLKIKVLRDGQPLTLEVTLGAW